MSIKFDELPNWTFSVEETSVGVYAIKGRDKNGRSIEMHGTNIDELTGRCRNFVLELKAKLEKKEEGTQEIFPE